MHGWPAGFIFSLWLCFRQAHCAEQCSNSVASCTVYAMVQPSPEAAASCDLRHYLMMLHGLHYIRVHTAADQDAFVGQLLSLIVPAAIIQSSCLFIAFSL
jgi:hypothetical protein